MSFPPVLSPLTFRDGICFCGRYFSSGPPPTEPALLPRPTPKKESMDSKPSEFGPTKWDCTNGIGNERRNGPGLIVNLGHNRQMGHGRKVAFKDFEEKNVNIEAFLTARQHTHAF
ncbi:cyclin-dependent kinase D-1 [Artemisia annua]|uniref:Cyclin-dependent kinase D-1 n=1 Tax=Artemisia annua TaxID=35608 RepID=A0A2U1NIF5_ARTAN|nr:cyclin-dependent kinase D-1 [Artemisia annua]